MKINSFSGLQLFLILDNNLILKIGGKKCSKIPGPATYFIIPNVYREKTKTKNNRIEQWNSIRAKISQHEFDHLG